MALGKQDIIKLYGRRARRYDFTANLYYLLGFREYAYRKKAVRELKLDKGDAVLEIGCGTGLNFPFLENAVGPEGKVIGLDLTGEMLEQARQKVDKQDWRNVTLVQADAARYEFPKGLGGIISTFAITLIPEYDQVIRKGCLALRPGKRFIVLDFKMPSNWLSRLAPLAIFLTRPFGVTRDLEVRHPWESIRKYMENFYFEEIYGGIVYIAGGERDKGC